MRPKHNTAQQIMVERPLHPASPHLGTWHQEAQAGEQHATEDEAAGREQRHREPHHPAQPATQTLLTYKASVYRWDGQWWLSARHAPVRVAESCGVPCIISGQGQRAQPKHVRQQHCGGGLHGSGTVSDSGVQSLVAVHFVIWRHAAGTCQPAVRSMHLPGRSMLALLQSLCRGGCRWRVWLRILLRSCRRHNQPHMEYAGLQHCSNMQRVHASGHSIPRPVHARQADLSAVDRYPLVQGSALFQVPHAAGGHAQPASWRQHRPLTSCRRPQ